MKNCKINLFFILLINLFIFSSCNESEGNILSYKLKGNDTLYICDISTIPNEIRNKKLSELIDSFHFISFEDNDTALFKPWKVYISDHHIGILQDAMSPFKLFDHTGKFLCDIGRIGQAEGEYTMLYSPTINEQDSAIWLTPLNGNKLLRYNMKGQFISSINVRPMHKPVIRCESDNTLTATNLYFKGMPGFLYLRVFPNDSIYYSVSEKEYSFVPKDLNGNFIGYNHEIWFYNNTKAFTYMTTAFDTLYTYDISKDKTTPRFTVHPPINESYYVIDETPSYFLINIYKTTGIKGKKLALADKNPGKFLYTEVQNDFLGNLPVTNFSPSNGWYYEMFEPIELIELIEEHLSKNNPSQEDKNILNTILSNIDDDGNNILFMGKLSKKIKAIF